VYKEKLLTQPDTIIHYPYRIVSARITRLLLRTGITPNQVTIFRGILNALALYFLVDSSWQCLIVFFVLFQINELFDHVDGELARVRNMDSRLGYFLEYLVDIPGSEMFGFFGLCTAIAVYKQTSSPVVFGVFMSIPMAAAIKETFRFSFVKRGGKGSPGVEPVKWLGIMGNRTAKERLIIIIRLFIAWQNHLVLWAALLYYPVTKYFHFNPLFWAIVCIALVTQLRCLGAIYAGFKDAITMQGADS